MIRINGEIFNPNQFPDGTYKLDVYRDRHNIGIEDGAIEIEWFYDSDAEVSIIWMLKKHFDNWYSDKKVCLYMPYIPNARFDRTKEYYEVFTLKYFADFINALNFCVVGILDPHSYVSEALFNNISIHNPRVYIKKAISMAQEEINDEALVAFYPDEGAMKRYSGMISMPYAFGIKKRDWNTGKIIGLDVSGDIDIADKNVIIIDDICSRGGTFYHSAKKLKELGTKKIYLYITHCENTIFDGELLDSGLIEKVFTTDSIYRGNDKRIEVFNV